MSKIKIEITADPQPPKLLSRREILGTDGVYKASNPHLRFVVNRGQCFIFGDANPLYISANYDIDSPRYTKVDEKIAFMPL